MRPPARVYRTSAPDVLKAWQEACEARAEWSRVVQAFAEGSVPGGGALVSESAWPGGDRFVGIQPAQVPGWTTADPPTNWRWVQERGTRFLIPRRGSAEQKRLSEIFKHMSPAPNPRAALTGMPEAVQIGLSLHAPHVIAHSIAGTLYGPGGLVEEHEVLDRIEVRWAVEWDDQADESFLGGSQRVDREIWTPIPLSQFHAEQEAHADLTAAITQDD